MASASAERIFFAVQNWWLSVWSNSVVDQASTGLLAAVWQSLMEWHPSCMLNCWLSLEVELELKSDGWLVLTLHHSYIAPSLLQDSPSHLLHLSTAQYLLGYSLLGAATVVCNCSRNATSIWGSIQAAGRLHAALLAKVLGLPMAFFDSQPLGRLLNRFTKVSCILCCQLCQACTWCGYTDKVLTVRGFPLEERTPGTFAARPTGGC